MSIKTPPRHFAERNKLTLKLTWEGQRTGTAQAILQRKNKDAHYPIGRPIINQQ